MRLWAVFALIWLHQPLALSAQAPEEWQAAARTVRRLPPDSFPQLPGAIRSALAARGCTVPQSFVEGRPHNVISGRFAPTQQRDWAVLCSHHDSSSILIFWDSGGAVSPDELGWTADAGFLQDTGAGRIGYSRVIAVARPERIRAYVAASGGPLPRPLDHDGIEDEFAEKASTVLYWEKGRWVTLTGAD